MRIAQINVVASLSTGRIAGFPVPHGHAGRSPRPHLPFARSRARRRAQLCHRQQGGNAAGPGPDPAYRPRGLFQPLRHPAAGSSASWRRISPTSCTCTTCTGITSISPCSLPGSGSTTCPWCGPCMTAGPTPATAPTTPWRAARSRWTAAAAGPAGRTASAATAGLGAAGDASGGMPIRPAGFLDQSARNWRDKRELFCGLRHMVLTTPSEWLRGEVKRSFLSGYPVYALPTAWT